MSEKEGQVSQWNGHTALPRDGPPAAQSTSGFHSHVMTLKIGLPGTGRGQEIKT